VPTRPTPRLRPLPVLALLALLTAAGALVACEPSIAPGKADPGEIGAPCANDEDCTLVSEPLCLKMGSAGYCSKDCALLAQFSCPDGAICESLGDQALMCLDGCCGQDDCRDGYRCSRRPELDTFTDLALCSEPGVCLLRCTSDAACEVGNRCDIASGECVPKQGANAGVGSPCTSGDTCNSGSCLTGFPGGYCTSACGTQFNAACEPGAECYALPGSTPTCLKICQGDGDCRAGYRCAVAASEGGTSDAVRAYCVPRCDSDATCPEGTHCDAGSGECLAGQGAPGPIGAFCGGGGDCLSGTCEAAWPNGYCASGCGTCAAPDVCVDGSCLSACAGPAQCRFGYVCVGGGCVPGCQSDADCGADLVCDTASGLCKQPASAATTVQTFFDQTVVISDTGAGETTFTVPEGALSAVVHVASPSNELMAIYQLYAPGNTLLFDITNPALSKFFFLPSERTFTGLLPPGPVFNFIPGDYKVSFALGDGSVDARVRIFGKVGGNVGDGMPATQALDVVLAFAGAPQGMNAAAARSDGDFQRALTEYTRLYNAMGVAVNVADYVDLGQALGDKLRVVDGVEGPDSELAQLLAAAPDAGQGMTFYFVDEIVDAQEGFTILGISGGIPGPPGIHGTPHSGVAVTLAGFRSDPVELGRTIAHEGGHYLGLFHTSEASGNSHDPLPDTAQCGADRDSNWDGYVTIAECAGRGAENFMFWLSGPNTEQTSVEQGLVLRRNPATR
jgi:hypothetical protein